MHGGGLRKVMDKAVSREAMRAAANRVASGRPDATFVRQRRDPRSTRCCLVVEIPDEVIIVATYLIATDSKTLSCSSVGGPLLSAMKARGVPEKKRF